ncbi:SapC family protein [Sphingomonas arantia]|uniref:SapC family protein n=1 Tax=Sphingomonas arantia TaxID=1460676 RepID=A0ABW4U171_9SPHN
MCPQDEDDGVAAWEVLGFEQHGTLGIRASGDAERLFVQIVVGEFGPAAADYPILFAKSPETGRFYAGALLRLQPGDDANLDESGRLRGYRPADLEREGFFVEQDRIVIDRELPMFVDGSGAPLFEGDGVQSAALQRVQRALGRLHAGLPATDAFIARLLERSLLEPIDIDLRFDDGTRFRLEDLYTISADAVAALPDATVLAMFHEGDLAACYTQIQSVRQIARMARVRNDRLAGA